MSRLRAMFLFLGLAAFGATTYELYVLKSEYASADAVDAGLLAVSTPSRVSCRVRILDACRAALGGLPRYARVQMRVQRIPAPGDNVAVFDLPTAWRSCIRFAGTAAEACTVLEANACTVPAVCGVNGAPQVEADTCACRGAGTCTVGGQPAPFGVTLAAGTFTGAGCVSRYCGPVMFGDDADWPAACPGGP